MNRTDVCRLETNYAGDLVELATHLQFVDAIYDQEIEEDGLHEYVYGSISGEQVEIIRLLGEECAAIFKLGSPMFFSQACLIEILQTLQTVNVRVAEYWTQESLRTGKSVPYELSSSC